jgi:alginate O-acetyltransferase complex protein AlgI
LYFSTAPRFRWVLLLLASYFFYMCWEPGYLLLILISTLIDYMAGLKMGAEPVQAKRKKIPDPQSGHQPGIARHV